MARLTNEERYRRVLLAAYERILPASDIEADLDLLDAMQDCIKGEYMEEWTVSKCGRIRFL